MAISFNDNIKISAPKPIDVKYLSTSNIPYVSISQVNNEINVGERYVGLTVNINNVEYWYKDGTGNTNLILKGTGDGVVSGGTIINNDTLLLNRTQGLSNISIDLSPITSGTGDGVVSGGTLSGNNLILNRTEGESDIAIDLSALSRDIYVSGGTLNGTILQLNRTEGESDLTIDLSALSGATDLLYSGATPSSITLGGINSGTTLTGKTVNQILNDLLVPTVNPIISPPSNKFKSNITTTREVGDVITELILTAEFDRGSIEPPYGTSGLRSGLPNTYNYTGFGFGSPSAIPSTSLTNEQIINNYTVIEGLNNWTNSIEYDAGEQPLDSSGGNYLIPLSNGITSEKITSIVGQYRNFYGSTSTTPASSSDVRSLTNSSFQTNNNNTITLNTGTVFTKFIVVLPPNIIIRNVIDLDAFIANITSKYEYLGIITVQDGGGTGTARNYNLYEMNIGTTYEISHAHEITTGI